MDIKDFAFTRQAGWVGFTLAGCPLGEGLLDYDEMAAGVDPGRGRGAARRCQRSGQANEQKVAPAKGVAPQCFLTFTRASRGPRRSKRFDTVENSCGISHAKRDVGWSETSHQPT
jgi:hypothetical protein